MAQDSRFPQLHIVDHPLALHHLAHLRDKRTSSGAFRQHLRAIARLIGYELARDLPTAPRVIETPLATIEAPMLRDERIAIISVLRAGLGMAEGVRDLWPEAAEGHIGLYRNHDSKKPVEYYLNLPQTLTAPVILCDPMLATGRSAAHALAILHKHGLKDADIRFLALVAAPEGMEVLRAAHPTLRVYAAALDSHLNENAYIVPGLGDAGDRLFGTG